MIERATGRTARVELWPPGRGIRRAYTRRCILQDSRAKERAPLFPSSRQRCASTSPWGPIVSRLAHFGLGRFEPMDSEVLVDGEAQR